MLEQPGSSVFHTHRVLSLTVTKSPVHIRGLVPLFSKATLVSPPVIFPQDLVISQYTCILEPLEDNTQ